MIGGCRGRAGRIRARKGRVALAVLLAGSTLVSAVGTAILPFSARAQSEGEWVDPLAGSQMTDSSGNDDQAVSDVGNGEADAGWVDGGPLGAAPVGAGPACDANGRPADAPDAGQP